VTGSKGRLRAATAARSFRPLQSTRLLERAAGSDRASEKIGTKPCRRFPQSRKILAEILAGVRDDEQAKIAGSNTARLYNFDWRS
jgi:hypothetical protein